jgi:hypothetical protein
MHSMVFVAPNSGRHHLGTPGRLRRNPQMLDPDDERYLSRRPALGLGFLNAGATPSPKANGRRKARKARK